MPNANIFQVEYEPITDCLTYNARTPLPILRACPTCACNFFDPVDGGNNCNLCQVDKAFFAPFEIGDTIPVQFNFNDYLNTDPENPTVGFVTSANSDGYISVQIVDANCNVVMNSIDLFANDYYVYYSQRCKKSAQIFFLETDDLPVDLCTFSILVTVYGLDANGNRVVVSCKQSEPYNRKGCEGLPATGKEKTCLVEGTYNKTDCFGRCYCDEITNYVGTSNRPFYLSMRVPYNNFDYIGDEKSEVIQDDEKVGFENTSSNIFTTALVPPYFQKCLSTIFCADVVSVCGKQFDEIIISNKRDENSDSLYTCMNFGLNNICSEVENC